MKVIFDIEADGLKATKIYVIVCKDIDTGEVHVFREHELDSFKRFANGVDLWIGHNIIAYDCVWVSKLVGVDYSPNNTFDTLVLSQLLNQGREDGHSLEAWGDRLKYPKIQFNDWSKLSEEMVTYCINDVELNFKVYVELMKIVKRNAPAFDKAIDIEMKSAWIARDMHENGFKFNIDDALKMRGELEQRLKELDVEIQKDFPPRSKLVKEYTPKLTKQGTISRTSVPRSWTDLSTVQPGCPFSLVEFVSFNPTSPKQVIERLWEAGWKPVDKTKGHLEAEKERDKEKLAKFKFYGYKINETNLATLPEDAPPACNSLVEYILVAARVRTLTEWIDNFNYDTGRVHGRFNALGTRTHRASHSNPNLGNVATKKSIKYNTPYLRDLAIRLGGRMRSMWTCESDALLVGTDMESAHLRIFAHLIDDQEFVKALTSGRKEDGTDPHSVNKRVLGDICVDRDRSKTFIFSFLNGAGATKVGEIFSCSKSSAQEALDRFVRGYPGLAKLKSQTIPRDAARGYFIGVDGRYVVNDSEHHMIGMYLQNMEAVLMKYANVMWREELDKLGIKYKQVNWVHDEWVTEVWGGTEVARTVGNLQADAIRKVGELFGLKCPMGGESKIGKNWLEVH